MKQRTRHFRFVTLVVSLGLAVGCSRAEQAEPGASEARASGALDLDVESLLEGAREEGTLVLNWTGSDWLPDVLELFNAEYNLDISLEHTPAADGADAATRLVQEYEAGRPGHTDLAEASALRVHVLNGGRGTAGVIEELDWAALPNIEPEMVTDNRIAVSLYHSVPTLTYNTDTVPAEHAPESLADALEMCKEGEYKFVTTSTTWESLLDPDQFWGPEKTLEFIEEYGACLSGFIGTEEMQRVASGEFDIAALDANDYRTKPLIEDGAPLALVVPSDFVAVKAAYFALPKHSVHPNVATLFADFLLTRAAQDIIYEATAADNHHVEGSQAKADMVEILSASATEPGQINYEHFRDNFDIMEKHEATMDAALEGAG